jgi:hypothetical protein
MDSITRKEGRNSSKVNDSSDKIVGGSLVKPTPDEDADGYW